MSKLIGLSMEVPDIQHELDSQHMMRDGCDGDIF